jgi:hypothetical protein
MKRLVVLLFFAALGVAAFAVIREEVERPSVTSVVKAARGSVVDSATKAKPRKIDGLGFPTWTAYGWKAIGGTA